MPNFFETSLAHCSKVSSLLWTITYSPRKSLTSLARLSIDVCSVLISSFKAKSSDFKTISCRVGNTLSINLISSDVNIVCTIYSQKYLLSTNPMCISQADFGSQSTRQNHSYFFKDYTEYGIKFVLSFFKSTTTILFSIFNLTASFICSLFTTDNAIFINASWLTIIACTS